MKTVLFTLALFTAGLSHATACDLEISASDTLQYDRPSLEVDRNCTSVRLTFTHTGKLAKNVMGHNWVLSKALDLNGIAQDGFKAGLENQYVKAGDTRVLAYTDVIGGGETTTIEFSLEGLDDAEYTYFCSFPGHWAVMKGVLAIREA